MAISIKCTQQLTSFFWSIRNHHISSHPVNALIHPTIDGNEMTVTCPTMDQPFKTSMSPAITDLKKIEVVMHKSKTTPWAFDMGEQAEAWFTQACGVQTKLVYLPSESYRPVLGNIAGDFKPKKGITFTDCASYMVATSPSLRAVQKMLDNPDFDVKPLRPNIVVESKTRKLQAWEEDFWSRLKIGDACFDTTSNCVRCSSIDIEFVLLIIPLS